MVNEGVSVKCGYEYVVTASFDESVVSCESFLLILVLML